MKTLIVCASVHHHNTEKVARVMAEVLGAKVCSPEAASSECLDNYNLIGFGSGIYYGRFHESLRARIALLPTMPSSERPAFVFSTSGLPWLWRFWHRPFTTLLTQKGFRVCPDPHSESVAVSKELALGFHDAWTCRGRVSQRRCQTGRSLGNVG